MIVLYPRVDVKGQDYSRVKKVTIPNQSMSLKDIIKRFMRRESLPVEQKGFYAENLGDLEKLARADITVRMERAEQLRSYIEKAELRMNALKKPPMQGDQSPKAGGEAPEPTAAGKAAASAAPLATS